MYAKILHTIVAVRQQQCNLNFHIAACSSSWFQTFAMPHCWTNSRLVSPIVASRYSFLFNFQIPATHCCGNQHSMAWHSISKAKASKAWRTHHLPSGNWHWCVTLCECVHQRTNDWHHGAGMQDMQWSSLIAQCTHKCIYTNKYNCIYSICRCAGVARYLLNVPQLLIIGSIVSDELWQ